MASFADAANASAASTAAAVKRLRSERDEARSQLAGAEKEAANAKKRLEAKIAEVEQLGTSSDMVAKQLQSQVSGLQEEVSDLKQQVAQAQAETRKARAEAEEAKSDRAALNATVTKLRGEEDALQDKLARANAKAAEAMEKAIDATAKVAESATAMTALRSEGDDLRSTVAELRSTLAQVKAAAAKEDASDDAVIAGLRAEVAVLRGKAASESAEEKRLKEQLAAARSDIAKLRGQLQSSEAALKAARADDAADDAALAKAAADLKAARADDAADDAALAKAGSDLAAARSEADSLRKQLKEAQAGLDAEKSKAAAAAKRVAQLEAEVERLKKEAREDDSSDKVTEEKLVAALAASAALEKANAELEEEVAALREEAKETDGAAAALAKVRQELAAAVADAKELRSRADAQAKQVAALQAEAKAADAAAAAQAKALASAEAEAKAANQQATAAAAEVAKVSAKLAAAEAAKQEAEAALAAKEAEVKVARAELKEAQKAAAADDRADAKLTKAYEKALAKVEQLQGRADAAEAKSAESKAATAEARAEAKALQSEVAGLQKQVAAAERAAAASAREVERAQSQLERATADAAAKQTRLDSAKEEVAALQGTVKELRVELKEAQKAAAADDRADAKLTKAYEKAQRDLEAAQAKADARDAKVAELKAALEAAGTTAASQTATLKQLRQEAASLQQEVARLTQEGKAVGADLAKATGRAERAEAALGEAKEAAAAHKAELQGLRAELKEAQRALVDDEKDDAKVLREAQKATASAEARAEKAERAVEKGAAQLATAQAALEAARAEAKADAAKGAEAEKAFKALQREKAASDKRGDAAEAAGAKAQARLDSAKEEVAALQGTVKELRAELKEAQKAAAADDREDAKLAKAYERLVDAKARSDAKLDEATHALVEAKAALKEAKAALPPPPPVFKVGDDVEVELKNKWYAATVCAVTQGAATGDGTGASPRPTGYTVEVHAAYAAKPGFKLGGQHAVGAGEVRRAVQAPPLAAAPPQPSARSDASKDGATPRQHAPAPPCKPAFRVGAAVEVCLPGDGAWQRGVVVGVQAGADSTGAPVWLFAVDVPSSTSPPGGSADGAACVRHTLPGSRLRKVPGKVARKAKKGGGKPAVPGKPVPMPSPLPLAPWVFMDSALLEQWVNERVAAGGAGKDPVQARAAVLAKAVALEDAPVPDDVTAHPRKPGKTRRVYTHMPHASEYKPGTPLPLLWLAVMVGGHNGIKWLTAAGCDTEEEVEGETPLLWACNAKHVRRRGAVVRALVQGGADVNCVGGEGRITPLHAAAASGRLHLIRVLAQEARAAARGAEGAAAALDPDAVDEDGSTALDCALLQWAYAMVEADRHGLQAWTEPAVLPADVAKARTAAQAAGRPFPSALADADCRVVEKAGKVQARLDKRRGRWQGVCEALVVQAGATVPAWGATRAAALEDIMRVLSADPRKRGAVQEFRTALAKLATASTGAGGEEGLAAPGKRALVLVCPQKDLLPGGAAAVQGGADLLPKLDLLRDVGWDMTLLVLRANHKQHSAFDTSGSKPLPEGTGVPPAFLGRCLPPHCVSGTDGASVPASLDTSKVVTVQLGAGGTGDVSLAALAPGSQAVQALQEAGVGEVVVAGLGMESTVAATALSAVQAGFLVSVVADACGGHDSEAMSAAEDGLVAAGVALVDLEALPDTPEARGTVGHRLLLSQLQASTQAHTALVAEEDAKAAERAAKLAAREAKAAARAERRKAKAAAAAARKAAAGGAGAAAAGAGAAEVDSSDSDSASDASEGEEGADSEGEEGGLPAKDVLGQVRGKAPTPGTRRAVKAAEAELEEAEEALEAAPGAEAAAAKAAVETAAAKLAQAQAALAAKREQHKGKRAAERAARQQAAQSVPTLALLSAQYGAKGKFASALPELGTTVPVGGEVKVTNGAMGGDPIRGTRKTLTVFAVVGKQVTTVIKGSDAVLPPPRRLAGPALQGLPGYLHASVVLKVEVGGKDVTVDVDSKVGTKADPLDLSSVLPKPSDRAQVTLVVGAVHTAAVREGDTLQWSVGSGKGQLVRAARNWQADAGLSDEPAEGKVFALISAQYGAKGKFASALPKLGTTVPVGGEVKVTNGAMGGDPIRGTRKTLTVFAVTGEEQEVEVEGCANIAFLDKSQLLTSAKGGDERLATVLLSAMVGAKDVTSALPRVVPGTIAQDLAPALKAAGNPDGTVVLRLVAGRVLQAAAKEGHALSWALGKGAFKGAGKNWTRQAVGV